MASKISNPTTESPSKKRPRLSRRQRRVKELLRKWTEEGDLEEQRETFEALKKGIDEGRKGYRQLFQ